MYSDQIQKNPVISSIKMGEKLANIDKYENAFSGYSNQKYAMEATPGYFYGGKKVSDKMKDLLPNSKVIIVLRDPVQRLFLILQV